MKGVLVCTLSWRFNNSSDIMYMMNKKNLKVVKVFGYYMGNNREEIFRFEGNENKTKILDLVDDSMNMVVKIGIDKVIELGIKLGCFVKENDSVMFDNNEDEGEGMDKWEVFWEKLEG